MTGNIIQIFNRAPFGLIATKDGRDFPIPPGYSHITSDLLRFAREQNPIPGSEDPYTTSFESFISVVAPKGRPQKDSLETVSQDMIDLLPKERINRAMLSPEAQQAETMATSGFPRGRIGVENATPGMVDPGKFDG